MLSKESIIAALEENNSMLRSFGLKQIALFGSYAAGEQRPDSDIDFLISFRKGRGSFDEYVHLRQFLEDLFKKNIDLCEEDMVKEELKPFILGDAKIEAKI